jgi:uncharacterized protein YjbI with pentapeptide repeats
MPACTAAKANFRGADLRGAFLRSAVFEGADFSEADLRDANVGRANLRDTVLKGADLRCVGADEADLHGAVADAGTRWPDGFKPSDHGVRVE